MNENLKRAISGIIYIAVMWTCTSYSETTFSLLFAILGIISIYEMWRLRKGKSKFLALLYILLPFFLIQLFGMTDSNYPNTAFDPSLILLILVLTWTFDTFAYLFGVTFGKHKIIPSISPKKSWEGFAGGFIFTIITAYIISEYLSTLNLGIIIITSLLLPFTATLGDFIASFYKRQAGVKDSGNLIPGHGGILDRMDAFMITIPMIYILTKIF
jgi:phosphatidate cytidylyltransferase